MSWGGGVERYAHILEVLASFPEGLSLTDIARLAQLPKASAHRLIKTLGDVGYVTGGGGRELYRLGPRLLRLLHLGAPSRSVAALLQPVLEALVEEFRETAFLAKLVGDEVHSIAMAVPQPTDQSFVQPGRVMPVNAAASAKAIIAFQSEEVIERLIARSLVRYTPDTCVDPAELRERLARVRQERYALCLNELDPGVMSIAMPVRLDGVGVLYSIGIVGLQSRFANVPHARLVAALHAAAESAAELLKHHGALPQSATSLFDQGPDARA